MSTQPLLGLILSVVLTLGTGVIGADKASPGLQPGKPVDYASLAFEPDAWRKRGLSLTLYPWAGQELVFLTTTNRLDPKVMAIFLDRLDSGWKLYADLTGRKPSLFKQIEAKPVLAAVPDASLTCGYGCGYIGATGIEVAGFYANDYPLVQRNPKAFPHYYFYEMGRNFYTFGDRHSLFITGYAVLMRYVCMDALGCEDPDRPTREFIEQAESLVAKGDLDFLQAFTTHGGLDEKAPRLKTPDGQWLHPSDQPVLYASAMLRLRKDGGGDAWLKRFFLELARCPKIEVKNRADALRQAWNWVIAASCAARKDLSPVFAARWKFPVSPVAAKALSEVRWTAAETDAAAVWSQVDPIVSHP